MKNGCTFLMGDMPFNYSHFDLLIWRFEAGEEISDAYFAYWRLASGART